MIRQTKQHGTLSKAVEVKVFLPEIPIVGMGKFRARMLHKRFRPPNGRWFTTSSVDDILERVNEELEREFSMCEFRLVELGFGRFNIIGTLKESLPKKMFNIAAPAYQDMIQREAACSTPTESNPSPSTTSAV